MKMSIKKITKCIISVFMLITVLMTALPTDTYAASKKVTLKATNAKNTKNYLKITVQINNKTDKNVDFSKDIRWIYKKVNGKWKKIKWDYYVTKDVSATALNNSKIKFTFKVYKKDLSEKLKKNKTYKIGISVNRRIRKVKFKI